MRRPATCRSAGAWRRSDLLRGDDGGRVRGVPSARRWTRGHRSRARRTLRRHQHRHAGRHRHHVDRLRPPGALGGTLAAIAAEKAGTIKPGVPVVVGRMPDDARAVVGRPTGTRRRSSTPTPTRGTSPGRAAAGMKSPSTRRSPATARCCWHWPAGIRWTTPSSRCGCSRPPRRTACRPRRRDRAGLTEARWPARLETLDTPRGRI